MSKALWVRTQRHKLTVVVKSLGSGPELKAQLHLEAVELWVSYLNFAGPQGPHCEVGTTVLMS